MAELEAEFLNCPFKFIAASAGYWFANWHATKQCTLKRSNCLSMKTKNCAICAKEETTLYRIQIEKGKPGYLYVRNVATCQKQNSIINTAVPGWAIAIKFQRY